MNKAVLAALCLVACGYPNKKTDIRIYDPVPPGGEGFSNALYQSDGVEMHGGHRIELINNGAVFDAIGDQLDRAQKSINIVEFIWRKGPPGDALLAKVAARARAGVRCRVLVDPLGSVDFDQGPHQALADAGCDVRWYHPLLHDTLHKGLARNHRKLVIVDGEVAFVGGFCIYKSWLGDGLSKDEWRDTNARVEGPAVKQMQQAFAHNWQEAGGGLLPADEFPDPAQRAGVAAAYVASDAHVDNTNAERMTQLLIASAKRRIWISNAYFIPSEAIAHALIDKAKEGVDVRVLAAGRVHDWKTVRAAQRSTYEQFLEVGVRIWEYQPSMMHAKTMVVDDRLVAIGSTNMDPLSMKWLDEGSLVAEDPALAARMAKDFEVDTGHSLEIERDGWARRGVLDTFAEKLTVLIGRYL